MITKCLWVLIALCSLSFLSYGMDVNNLPQQMWWAIAENRIQDMALLLSGGLSPDTRPAGFRTAVYEAAHRERKELLEMLINAGADVKAKNLNGGDTALHIAVKNGNKEIIKMLLDAGANPLQSNDFEESAASITQDPEILQLLAQQ